MAIFRSDLEKINTLNEKNNKINIRSELIQVINYQNDLTDYSDLQFELAINFKKRFDKNRLIFNEMISNVDQQSIFNIFEKCYNKNKNIFVSFERMIYQIQLEENISSTIFKMNTNIRNRDFKFDLLNNFINKTLPNQFINQNNNSYEFDDSIIYSSSVNLKKTKILSNNYSNKEFPTYNSIPYNYKLFTSTQTQVDSSIYFLKSYMGFNFIKTNDTGLITNSKKPLSLMSIYTSLNNILNNSFKYMSCNSLLHGIYTHDEFQSKTNLTEYTNIPFFENDITKEFLPIKYSSSSINNINNEQIRNLINELNTTFNINSIDSGQPREIIKSDIFDFESFLNSNASLDETLNFTSICRDVITIGPDSRKLYQSDTSSILSDPIIIADYDKEENIYTTPTNYFLNKATYRDNAALAGSITYENEFSNILTLIGNHINSNHVKLMYGTLYKNNNIPNYYTIKNRSVINSNKKGILNFKFEDYESDQFTSSILKTRLMCDNIVKTYKKYFINEYTDLLNPFKNKLSFLLKENSPADSINLLNSNLPSYTLIDNVIKQMTPRNVNSNKLIDAFNQYNSFYEIFKKDINEINKKFIIRNNLIIGDQNLNDYIQNNQNINNIDNSLLNIDFINVKNLNNIIEDFEINTSELNNNLKPGFNQNYDTIQGFINQYYNDNLNEFKNTHTFFQSIKEICENDIEQSSDRSEILNNASIFWLFNDACKEMSEAQKDYFQEQFVSMLITYIINSENNNFLINNNDLIEKINSMIFMYGPSANTISEIAPFFCFFSNESQNITPQNTGFINPSTKNKILQNNRATNEKYNITNRIYETNGKVEHFLSIPNYLFEQHLNMSYNFAHKLSGKTKLVEIDEINNFFTDSNSTIQSLGEKTIVWSVINVINNHQIDNKRNIMLSGFNTYRHVIFDENENITSSVEYPYYFIPQITLQKENENNTYAYYIYNTAFTEALIQDIKLKIESARINTPNHPDIPIIESIINTNHYNIISIIKELNNLRFQSPNILPGIINWNQVLDLISYRFSFSKLFYITSSTKENIFYKIVKLFKDLIKNVLKIPQGMLFDDFYNQLINNRTTIVNTSVSGNENLNRLNSSVFELKMIIKNCLKVASKIYSKMFNDLQSYSNLSDRIFESNMFTSNNLDVQTLLTSKNINNGDIEGQINDLNDGKLRRSAGINGMSYDVNVYDYGDKIFEKYAISNSAQLDEYYKLLFFGFANDLIDNPSEISNINPITWEEQYRSFATKKFVYFLNEILGIEENEIRFIMEKILVSTNVQSNNNLINTRFSNINDIDDKKLNNDVINEEYEQRLTINEDSFSLQSRFNKFKNLNNFEFMINPFEIFNMHDSKLFQNLIGLSNDILPSIDYDYEAMDNLLLPAYYSDERQSTIFIEASNLNVRDPNRIYDFTTQIQNDSFLNNNFFYSNGFRTRIDWTYLIKVTNHLTSLNIFKAGRNKKMSFNDEMNNLDTHLELIGLNQNIDKDNPKVNLINNMSFYSSRFVEYKDCNNPFNGDQIGYSPVDYKTLYANKRTNLAPDTMDTNLTLRWIYNNAWTYFDNSSSEYAYGSKKWFNNFYLPSFVFMDRIDFTNEFTIKNKAKIWQGFFAENKKNVRLKSILNLKKLFENTIKYSFNTFSNYGVVKLPNSDIRKSGLQESYSYNNNFLKMKMNSSVVSNFQNIVTQNYVDISANWYNHIMHGLIVNDLALSNSFDLLRYYYKNFLIDFENNISQLKSLRDLKISLGGLNDIDMSFVKSKFNTDISYYDNNLLKLSVDNVKLQKNYLKSLIKMKSAQSIQDEINIFSYIVSQNFHKFYDVVQKITKLKETNNNRGDYLMSYFDDFYIKDLYDIYNNQFNNITQKINKNYEINLENKTGLVRNQAETLLGSHILTVGVNNDFKLDNNDVILIKVEMTDHDFPEIIWEPKIFEYYAGFEDIENIFLQHKQVIDSNIVNNYSIRNIPIQINSFYVDLLANLPPSSNIVKNNKETLKDRLILDTTTLSEGLDVSNNISSYNTYLNPFTFHNDDKKILDILNYLDEDVILSKLQRDFRNKLEASEQRTIKEELLKRCIHNQRLSFHLKKMSKILNGFEPNTEFSLNENSGKWMQGLFVLADIYDLFIENIKGNNVDNIKEIYPFTYEEISNSVEKNAYSYADGVSSAFIFHKLNFTTNPNINLYFSFMCNLTKALLPDYNHMMKHNFQKIYTLAIDPKDFIVTGLNGGANQFVPNVNSELIFEKINRVENNQIIENKIIDEIGTEPNFSLRILSERSPEVDNITYFNVFKNNHSKYVPRNVSFRISTMILE